MATTDRAWDDPDPNSTVVTPIRMVPESEYYEMGRIVAEQEQQISTLTAALLAITGALEAVQALGLLPPFLN